MTREEIETEIRSLKNILEQRDNDALEAMDQFVVVVKEGSLVSLLQAIRTTLESFYDSAKNRIALRAELRELIGQLDDLEE